MQATTNAHFEESAPYNPFTWITNIIEVCLLSQIPGLPQLTKWLSWMKEQWPDVQCPTLANLAQKIQSQFPSNDSLSYELHQKGNGISYSNPKTEIVWYMNKAFRCGLEINRWKKKKVFDFTRYDRSYEEPQRVGERNWSLLDSINQKGIRKQDKPIAIEKFTDLNYVQDYLKKTI
jgi:hypothetical protein